MISGMFLSYGSLEGLGQIESPKAHANLNSTDVNSHSSILSLEYMRCHNGSLTKWHPPSRFRDRSRRSLKTASPSPCMNKLGCSPRVQYNQHPQILFRTLYKKITERHYTNPKNFRRLWLLFWQQKLHSCTEGDPPGLSRV